jgi:hypothetical protein
MAAPPFYDLTLNGFLLSDVSLTAQYYAGVTEW